MRLGPREARERRIRSWQSVCGCIPGSLAVLAGLAWRGTVLMGVPSWSASRLLLEFTVVLAMGLAAKALALLVARLALLVELPRPSTAASAAEGE